MCFSVPFAASGDLDPLSWQRSQVGSGPVNLLRGPFFR
jgi:hypothetical protein